MFEELNRLAKRGLLHTPVERVFRSAKAGPRCSTRRIASAARKIFCLARRRSSGAVFPSPSHDTFLLFLSVSAIWWLLVLVFGTFALMIVYARLQDDWRAREYRTERRTLLFHRVEAWRFCAPPSFRRGLAWRSDLLGPLHNTIGAEVRGGPRLHGLAS